MNNVVSTIIRFFIEAREAEKRLVEAQKKAAEAELVRLKAVKKATRPFVRLLT